jgi:dipeptidyl aminopeptidase/acylaminoacyl peptidase
MQIQRSRPRRTRFQRRVPAVVLVLTLSVAHLKGQAKLRPWLDLETADPSVSSDGKTVAFVWLPSDEDKWGIYLAPMTAGVPSLFAGTDDRGPAYSPKWSPDGKWIAFLRSESAQGAALFVKPRAGGE